MSAPAIPIPAPVGPPAGAASGRIPEPYLLVSNISFAIRDGRLVVPALWAKDLLAHAVHIEHLAMAAPCCIPARVPDAAELDPRDLGGSFHTTALPDPRSFLASILLLPVAAMRLWTAIGAARVVHCGVAGWPLPYGWVATVIARVRRRFLIVLVESAPWRAAAGERASLRRRLKAGLFEAMARWCVRRADLAFTTQGEYAASLGRGSRRPVHVLHASWIGADRVLPAAAAERGWEGKLADPSRPLRVAFAGRLTADKGVRVVIEAAGRLAAMGIPAEIEVFGDGELRAECERAAAGITPPVRITLRGAVPYDASFFESIGAADALVVPSLGDEQPRIVYDAFARAVPVIASDTPGIRDCVRPGVEGALVTPGDAGALAAALAEASRNRSRLRDMGLASLRRAASFTHAHMHARRSELILATLAESGR